MKLELVVIHLTELYSPIPLLLMTTASACNDRLQPMASCPVLKIEQLLICAVGDGRECRKFGCDISWRHYGTFTHVSKNRGQICGWNVENPLHILWAWLCETRVHTLESLGEEFGHVESYRSQHGLAVQPTSRNLQGNFYLFFNLYEYRGQNCHWTDLDSSSLISSALASFICSCCTYVDSLIESLSSTPIWRN